jgi:hypothetical protein
LAIPSRFIARMTATWFHAPPRGASILRRVNSVAMAPVWLAAKLAQGD